MDYSQFKGKPFQVISKLGVRYTGIFDHISQEDQTICLAQVYSHGTENRPTARKMPGSNTTLGWVRFHTESIDALALVENYVPPGGEEAPVDPILASVSESAPRAAPQPLQVPQPQQPSQPPQAYEPPPAPQPPPPAPPPAAQASSSGPSGARRHGLPSRPDTASAATAMDRVQQSMSDLAVDGGRQRRQPQPRAPQVPDAEFDFGKSNQKFEKFRDRQENWNGNGKGKDGSEVSEVDVGTPDEEQPHPIAIQAPNQNGRSSAQGGASGVDGAGAKKPIGYNKSSFFDNLSGESTRVSRAEERGRNYDTFGEAGGEEYSAGHLPHRTGYGGGQGRGGYPPRGGYGGDGRGGRGFGERGRGRGRGRGRAPDAGRAWGAGMGDA